MADIQIPQRQVPQMQFQGAPGDLIQALYNRPKQGEIASQAVTQAVNDVYSRYLQNQELKAKAFEAGGPYLMNLLYGGRSQAPGVGAATPSNAPSAPQGSAQTLNPQSDYHPQDPSGLIKQSIAAGHPDHSGIYSQGQMIPPVNQSVNPYGFSPEQLASMGKFGQGALTNVKNLGDIGMQPLTAAEKQASIRTANSKFASPEQGAAVASGDPNAISEAYGGQAPLEAYQYAANKAMEVKKTIAGEVSKQSADSQEIRNLQTLAQNFRESLGTDLGATGNLKGKLYQFSGGRVGSGEAANMQNSTIPLATSLNTVLSHRFNAGEVAALSESLIPQPKDTPAYRKQKLDNLTRLLDVMEAGNEQNVKNVAKAIMTGQVPKIGIETPKNTPSKAPSINSQAEYDALPPGSHYTWNGQPHIKGKS